MTKIYTKTGDDGFTGLYGGSRVKKNSLIVKCYGNVDELIANLGLAYAECFDEEIKNSLRVIQKELSTLAAELSSDEMGLKNLSVFVNGDDISNLEKGIDKIYDIVPQQKDFIIPGATVTSAQIHIARTKCRELERMLLDLDEEKPVRKEVLVFINRLSDYLFALARYEEYRSLSN